MDHDNFDKQFNSSSNKISPFKKIAKKQQKKQQVLRVFSSAPPTTQTKSQKYRIKKNKTSSIINDKSSKASKASKVSKYNKIKKRKSFELNLTKKRKGSLDFKRSSKSSLDFLEEEMCAVASSSSGFKSPRKKGSPRQKINESPRGNDYAIFGSRSIQYNYQNAPMNSPRHKQELLKTSLRKTRSADAPETDQQKIQKIAKKNNKPKRRLSV
jgi:hypothetical protein